MPSSGSARRSVADPRICPAVARTVEAGVFDEVGSFEEDNEADFDFGLQLYLDGVAAFIARVG